MIRRSLLAAIVATFGCGSAPPPPPPSTDGVVGSERWPAPTTRVDTHGPTRRLAAREIFLGTRDRATKTTRTNAWMDLGFDLDGRATSDAASATNAGVCARDPRARKSINGDGHGGVDNNFGSQVMPLLRSFVPDPEGQSEGAIRDGEWTVMLQIDDLGGDDDASAPGTLLLVANLGHPPTFTAEDRWPVVRVLGRFPDAFIAHGQWVSGFARSTFPLRIQRDAGLLRLYLDPGLVVVDLASGKTTVAGVLPLSAHVGSTETVVRAFGGCRSDRTELGQPSPVTDDTVKSVVEAADLVAGGADFQDPTVPCNAVSLGIGLTMTPTGEPSGTAPWPEVPDRCGTEGDVAGP